MRFLVVSALCLIVSPVAAQDMPPAFNTCTPCHAIGEGAPNKVGPQLNGVVGLLVGGVGDYSYSAAMIAARDEGMEWDAQTLTRYLKSPKHFMPGTSMAFAGFVNRSDIDAIIAYLETFDVDGIRVEP